MLEEVFYQDGVEIQNSVSISLKREICEHLETLQKFFKGYFYLDGIKVEPWIRDFFLSDINCIEDFDVARDERIYLRGGELKYNCSLTQKALGNSDVL
jgi:hypothetical protein